MVLSLPMVKREVEKLLPFLVLLIISIIEVLYPEVSLESSKKSEVNLTTISSSKFPISKFITKASSTYSALYPLKNKEEK